jgi:integrase
MRHDTVKVGNFTARLWLAADGRWKWHTHRAGKRVLCAAKTLDKARDRARAQLKALRQGKDQLAELTPDLVSEFLAWRHARVESPPIADAIMPYLAHLKQRKIQTRILDSDLAKFAAAHPHARMAEITAQQVQGYLADLPVGPRRHNNVRTTLVSFFRWARKMEMLPDTMTAPERTHALKIEAQAVAVYTPAQFRALLEAAPEEWRLALAIGGLAGLRTEEIAGLRWEDIKLGRKLIEVRAEICKTRRRRLVPILPALETWMRKSKPTAAGMVAPSEGSEPLIKRLKRAKVHYVRNGLRHSYGSYRCAMVKSAGQVALEMGNSEHIVRAHYLEMQDRKAATKWFQTGYFSGKTPANPHKH